MGEIKRIELEGFEDFRGDFDTGIYMVKPVIQLVDGGTIENFVEDFCINVSLGIEPEDDDFLDRKAVQNCLYRVRKAKQTPNFKYWRCVVDIFIDDENNVYEIIEQEGF